MTERLSTSGPSCGGFCEQCFGNGSDCPRLGEMKDQATGAHPLQPWDTGSWNDFLDTEVTAARDPEGPCLMLSEVEQLAGELHDQVPPPIQPAQQP